MGKKRKEHWLIEKVKENSVPILLASLGALGAVYNLYLVSQLSPLVQDINYLKDHVRAIEVDRSDSKPLIERFIKVEEKVSTIQDDVKQIKNYLLP